MENFNQSIELKNNIFENGIYADGVTLIPNKLQNGKWAWVAMSFEGDIKDYNGDFIDEKFNITSVHQNNKYDLAEFEEEKYKILEVLINHNFIIKNNIASINVIGNKDLINNKYIKEFDNIVEIKELFKDNKSKISNYKVFEFNFNIKDESYNQISKTIDIIEKISL